MKIYHEGLKGAESAKHVIDSDLTTLAESWEGSFNHGAGEGMSAFGEILKQGGKRLRGVLGMQSYYAHGGEDPEVALGVARFLELVQAQLLIIDDIADRSDTRRGGPSAHIQIGQMATALAMNEGAAHYATSQATVAALLGREMAMDMLLHLPVSAEVIVQAQKRLHIHATETAVGQMNDLYNEATTNPLSQADIEDVLMKKTAYYSFLSPLELGACLAGKQELEPELREYALNLGCVYQIRDDIIGTFGNEKKTGKSRNDDIREGKMTLLAQHVLEAASPDDRKFLAAVFGNPDTTSAACDQVRIMMKRNGSLAYVNQRLKIYRDTAHSSLTKAAEMTHIDTNFLYFLNQLTDFVSKRTA